MHSRISVLKDCLSPRALANLLWGPRNPVTLRCFEIAFTLQFAAWMGLLYLHPFDWLGEAGFSPDVSLLNQGYWKPWPKLAWWGVWLFGLLLWGGVLMILCDCWKRVGLWLAFGCSVYVLYADPLSAFTISRLNVLIFLVLATAPGSYQDSQGNMVQSVSAVRVAQLVIVALYFGAGWSKVAFGDWLKHDDIIWTHMTGKYRTDFAAWLLRVMPMGYWTVQKYLAMTFELGAPVLFFWRKTRLLAVVMGLGFHGTIAFCLWSIWPFALLCVTFYPVFLPEPWLQAVYGRWAALWRAVLPAKK